MSHQKALLIINPLFPVHMSHQKALLIINPSTNDIARHHNQLQHQPLHIG